MFVGSAFFEPSSRSREHLWILGLLNASRLMGLRDLQKILIILVNRPFYDELDFILKISFTLK